MTHRTLTLALAMTTLGLAGVALAQFAQPLTPGNLVVTRVGDGSSPLSSSAHRTFLVEYTTTASAGPVQQAPSPLTNSGTSTSELQITYNDGIFAIAGYNATPGTLTVAATTADVVNRGFVRFRPDGSFLQTVWLSDAYSGNSNRGAIASGAGLWTSGTATSPSNGVRYVDTSGSPPYTSVRQSSSVTNIRVLNAFAGKLYFTTQSGAFIGVNTFVGVDFPSHATPDSFTAVRLPGITNDTVNSQNMSPYDFVFVDQNTLYVTCDRSPSNGGGLIKYTYDATTMQWRIAYKITVGLTTGLRSVTYAGLGAGGPLFYVINAETRPRLLAVTDSGPLSSFQIIETSPVNTAFRGVEFIKSSGPGPAVSGSIRFTGRVASFPPTVNVQFLDPTTFAIVHTASGVALSATAEADRFDFSVSGAGLPPTSGSYLVSVFPAGFLRQNVGPVNTGTGATGQAFELLNGDIDRNNAVDIDDFLTMAGTYEVSPPTEANADLTGDGNVDIDDFLVLAGNYETSGEQPNP